MALWLPNTTRLLRRPRNPSVSLYNNMSLSTVVRYKRRPLTAVYLPSSSVSSASSVSSFLNTTTTTISKRGNYSAASELRRLLLATTTTTTTGSSRVTGMNNAISFPRLPQQQSSTILFRTTTTTVNSTNNIIGKSIIGSRTPSSLSSSLPPPPHPKKTLLSWMKQAVVTIVSTVTLYAFYVEYSAEQLSKQHHKATKKMIEKGSRIDDIVDIVTNRNRSMVVELPRIYNWEALNTYWSHRPISTIYRLLQINYHLLPLLYRYVQDFIVLPKIQQQQLFQSNHKEQNSATLQQQQIQLQHRHAVAWREALTELGPAFIKAGQQISIRPDLVSPTVLQALQQLCDNVRPISNEIAYQILRQEFKVADITDVFLEPPQLVASASLGQVYRGKLKVTTTSTSSATASTTSSSSSKNIQTPNDPSSFVSSNNDKEEYIDVAIKVQRPGMVESFSLDLFLLQRFSIVVDFVTSICTVQPPFHQALYESFANGSYSELDYEQEASNQMYFYTEFQKRTLPVIVPKVYTEYTTRTVLTSQWIDGIKLADAPLEQIRKLIPVGVELFLTQLLDLGTFHADPHVGNLLVQNGTGTLCLIDFGLCATVSEQDRRAMTMAIVHIIQRDFATLIHEDSKALGFLPQDCDTTELFPILTKILTVGLLDNPSSNIRVRRRKLLEISGELNDVFFHYPFTVPPYFALITRGLGLLEGIALSGDEDFDIFQAAAPYARRRAMQILYGRITNHGKKNTTSPCPTALRSTI